MILYVFGVAPYVVLSGSMEPTIETGSLCFINKNEKFENIKKDDVIAFKLVNGTLVSHRAVEINEFGIVTKGDNNKAVDGDLVKKENFVGKNVFSIPKVGYVVKAFQSTKGKIIIVTTVVLLFAVGLLFGDDKKEKLEN